MLFHHWFSAPQLLPRPSPWNQDLSALLLEDSLKVCTIIPGKVFVCERKRGYFCKDKFTSNSVVSTRGPGYPVGAWEKKLKKWVLERKKKLQSQFFKYTSMDDNQNIKRLDRLGVVCVWNPLFWHSSSICVLDWLGKLIIRPLFFLSFSFAGDLIVGGKSRSFLSRCRWQL